MSWLEVRFSRTLWHSSRPLGEWIENRKGILHNNGSKVAQAQP